MQKVLSLSKRRGFIFPGSEIYGGLANSWDYGPLGVELKNNIKQEWWRRFVHARADIVGIDAALLMNSKVWEASGHLKNFSDALVECKSCHKRFRQDEILSSKINPPAGGQKSQPKADPPLVEKCPECGGDITSARPFNLMLKTFLGPVASEDNVVYFRPETAQAMFVNFKNILDTNRPKLPFGIAQQGKAFRNEITPGNFIFRMREFEQMEIEYFVKESEWEKHFEYWLKEMRRWLKDLGVSAKKLHYVDIPDGERAHYSKRTVDIEYEYPFGREELYGLAYRGDFDLRNHMEASGQDLRYTDAETNEKFLPHVIEPTWGVDRSVLVAMLEAYHEEKAPTAEKGESETRAVLKFPTWLAPVKVAVLPLAKKAGLPKVAKSLYEELSGRFVCEYDETQSIGRRYRRQDEIGTPFCVTVDFETLKDDAVTVRDRDTMRQERVKVDKLRAYLEEQFNK